MGGEEVALVVPRPGHVPTARDCSVSSSSQQLSGQPAFADSTASNTNYFGLGRLQPSTLTEILVFHFFGDVERPLQDSWGSNSLA